ncbi:MULTISPECIES: hypothetical protein [unclassified Microcoleus]|uniref:hypothetical protein n=1 Tax=unclassified Microcoleus TaxID=2642155 RepID=UPI0025ED22CB|nr:MULTISPECIES: hypothetical protein [unclassified Microcoleus]
MTIGVWIVGKPKAVAFFLNNSEFTTARALNLKKTRFFSIWVDRLLGKQKPGCSPHAPARSDVQLLDRGKHPCDRCKIN